jgi:hypothetical protein
VGTLTSPKAEALRRCRLPPCSAELARRRLIRQYGGEGAGMPLLCPGVRLRRASERAAPRALCASAPSIWAGPRATWPELSISEKRQILASAIDCVMVSGRESASSSGVAKARRISRGGESALRSRATRRSWNRLSSCS